MSAVALHMLRRRSEKALLAILTGVALVIMPPADAVTLSSKRAFWQQAAAFEPNCTVEWQSNQALPRRSSPRHPIHQHALLRGGSDAIGRVIGYNTIEYFEWQSRLLVFSSVLMGASAAAALAAGQATLATHVGLASAASVNYWRRPGPGWRRDLDFLLATIACAYCTFAGQSLHGVPNAIALGGFGCFFICFRRSFLLSVGDGGDGAWARWHALGHAFVAVATISLAVGGADGWLTEPLPLLRPRRNPLGAATLALAAIDFAAEWWRAWRRSIRSRPERKV